MTPIRMRWVAAVLVPLACLGFALWWFSPGHVLKRRTSALLDTITIDPGAGTVSRGFQASALDGFLAPHITLDVPDDEARRSWSRDDVAAGFRHVAGRAEFTRFEMQRFMVIEIGAERAEIAATIDCEVRLHGRTRVRGPYQTSIRWEKSGGRWKVNHVTMTAL